MIRFDHASLLSMMIRKPDAAFRDHAPPTSCEMRSCGSATTIVSASSRFGKQDRLRFATITPGLISRSVLLITPRVINTLDNKRKPGFGTGPPLN
ncbi:hypothetical protein X566_04810 [Afipia sp. P52-10]|uniref:hypothetical protein n=1 Tax=Afipia sp. P52-10 TaxID=1429916 RepID=UPI0003DF1E20|nr:hypothetical protein [Afipia sp. P52-10]ETR78976.1 hypothetical protein X566_04810 [Afipia sp. P52-10]